MVLALIVQDAFYDYTLLFTKETRFVFFMNRDDPSLLVDGRKDPEEPFMVDLHFSSMEDLQKLKDMFASKLVYDRVYIYSQRTRVGTKYREKAIELDTYRDGSIEVARQINYKRDRITNFVIKQDVFPYKRFRFFNCKLVS